MDGKEKSQLLKDWIKFKKAEGKAKRDRVALEAKIKELYPFEGKKGKAKTFKDEELGFKTVITKEGETVKLDQEKYKEARDKIPVSPDNLRPEKIVYQLDIEGYNWLKKNNPEIYKLVSDCVTITPKKGSVKVEKI